MVKSPSRERRLCHTWPLSCRSDFPFGISHSTRYHDAAASVLNRDSVFGSLWSAELCGYFSISHIFSHCICPTPPIPLLPIWSSIVLTQVPPTPTVPLGRVCFVGFIYCTVCVTEGSQHQNPDTFGRWRDDCWRLCRLATGRGKPPAGCRPAPTAHLTFASYR